MYATNIDKPQLKLILIAVGAVVIIHVLTAMALAMVKTSAPVSEPPTVTPSIEILLLPPPVESEKVKSESEVKVQLKAESVAAKPTVISESKPVEKAIKPVVEKDTFRTKVQTVKSKTIRKQPDSTQQTNQQLQSQKTDNSQLEAETWSKALAEKVQADADSKAAIQAEDLRKSQALAKTKADQKAKAESEAEDARAAAVAQAKADQAKADQDAAEKAAQAKANVASNEPVSFTASNANWASQPNFNFPSRANRGTSPGDTFNVILILRVNKQGGIDSVRVAQSSGSTIIDKEAQKQVRSGRFKPFTKNNMPVIGNVTLPVSYKVP